MDPFDEYQRSLRHKYGYHSFLIIFVLGIINFNLHLFFDFQWGETQSLEFVLLLFFGVAYSIVMNIYNGAYFPKKQKALRLTLLFGFAGISNIYLSFSPHSPLIINGLLTTNSFMLVSGLVWLSIPSAYLTRILMEKKQAREEN